jgi:hypothetical protein
MSHEAIVVSEDGFKAMNFSTDFRKYAREHGIRDPFEVSRQLFSKRCRREGTDLIVDFDWDEETGKIKEDPYEPTRAEKDAYIKMRDEYVACRCFYEIGYESFLFHTKPKDYECNYDISYMRNEIEFIPCKSADRQCTFDCPKFAECALNGTWKPD